MKEIPRNSIVLGDSLEILCEFPKNTIDMCVTSPPFYKCRSYVNNDEIGQEKNPSDYIEHLSDIFVALHDVLKPSGTLWLNIGDRHAPRNYKDIGIRNGELMGIPSLVMEKLRSDGWFYQDRIIWHKPNAMPSSVKVHFTPDFEEILVFSKSKRFYFEQQFEPLKRPDAKSVNAPKKHGSYGRNTYSGFSYNAKDLPLGRNKRSVWCITTAGYKGPHTAVFPQNLVVTPILAGSPQRVCQICGFQSKNIYDKRKNQEWESSCGSDSSGNYSGISKKEYKKHGAQDASDVKRRTLKSMRERRIIGLTSCGCTPESWEPAIVIDPFVGSGTVPIVAKKLGRDYIGIDIDENSIREAKGRIESSLQPVTNTKSVGKSNFAGSVAARAT